MEHASESDIFVGEHFQTGVPSKSTILFMEDTLKWFCNSCGKTFANKNNFKTHGFNHVAYYKLASGSAILVGRHSQAGIT